MYKMYIHYVMSHLMAHCMYVRYAMSHLMAHCMYVRYAMSHLMAHCMYVRYAMSHLMAHCMYVLQRKAVSQLESTEASHRSTVDRLAQLQKENQELQAQLLGEKRKYEESLDSVERELDSVKDRLSEKTDLLVCLKAVCSEIACL